MNKLFHVCSQRFHILYYIIFAISVFILFFFSKYKISVFMENLEINMVYINFAINNLFLAVSLKIWFQFDKENCFIPMKILFPIWGTVQSSVSCPFGLSQIQFHTSIKDFLPLVGCLGWLPDPQAVALSLPSSTGHEQKIR